MGTTLNRFGVVPPSGDQAEMSMLPWRLRNDKDDYTDCSLQITHTGGYTISNRRGGDLTFTALAIDWRTAQEVIDDRRKELLRQGWKHSF